MFHCFIAYVIFIFYFIIIIFFFLHFPLSGPVPTYISLLIIPCMIVYVTNNIEPWTLNLDIPRGYLLEWYYNSGNDNALTFMHLAETYLSDWKTGKK